MRGRIAGLGRDCGMRRGSGDRVRGHGAGRCGVEGARRWYGRTMEDARSMAAIRQREDRSRSGCRFDGRMGNERSVGDRCVVVSFVWSTLTTRSRDH